MHRVPDAVTILNDKDLFAFANKLYFLTLLAVNLVVIAYYVAL